MGLNNKSLFTIRKKKHERHPQLTVDADRTTFTSMSITHSKKKGKKNNLPLKHNPNPEDKRPAYLRKQVVKDFKFRFSKAFKNYQISDEDAVMIMNYLENKKKK